MRFFIKHVVRYALRHKVLGVINILSVALGVSTYLAVQIANRSATAAFRAGIDVVAGRANVEVRGTLDDRLFPKLQKIPGVTAATPLVERVVTLPDWPGEYLHVFGVDPFTNASFENFKVSKSAGESFDADVWFGNPRSLAVSKKFADSHKLKRGDSIRVKFGERVVDLVLGSVLEAKDGDTRFAAMDIGWAQEMFGWQGKLTGVLFQISDPNNPEPVRQRIRELVPPDAVVQEPGERSGQVEQMLSGFALNLTALSMVSLLVGVFLIYNTVTASVVRRRSEVGILRALGASRAKVRWLFLGEAALYGMIGSVTGCFGGVLMANYLVGAVSKTITNLYVLTSIDHFYLPFWQIPLVLLTGMGSVLVGASIPANAGANLTPLRALNMGVLIERSERPRNHWIVLSGGIRGRILHLDRILLPLAAPNPPVRQVDRTDFSFPASPAACRSKSGPITLSARHYDSGPRIGIGDVGQHFDYDLFVPQNGRSMVGTQTRRGPLCRSVCQRNCWVRKFRTGRFDQIFAIPTGSRNDRYLPEPHGNGER
jgi:putative ABC transport system permease protein